MTITPALLYWITRLDEVKELLAGLTIILSIGLAIGLSIMSFEVCSRYAPNYNRLWLWFLLLIPLCLGVVNAFIPSSKEAAAILILPKVANTERIQAMPDKLLSLADEWLKELSPKGK